MQSIDNTSGTLAATMRCEERKREGEMERKSERGLNPLGKKGRETFQGEAKAISSWESEEGEHPSQVFIGYDIHIFFKTLWFLLCPFPFAFFSFTFISLPSLPDSFSLSRAWMGGVEKTLKCPFAFGSAVRGGREIKRERERERKREGEGEKERKRERERERERER